MSIATSSLLVELNISVWGANKLDREATETVTSNNSAVPHAAKVHKDLMAGTPMRKKIADFVAGCRSWHVQQTLPWADKGARLLPMSVFFDYKADINTKKLLFDQMVTDFLQDYPNYVTSAQQSLGSLFKASDYPSAEEIRSKFGFRLVFTPVPEAGDFRLDVGAADIEALKSQYDVAFQERLGDAMREPWERLHKMLTIMSSKLEEGTEEQKKRYHESFLTNAQDMCNLLTHLNITKDAKLEKARVELEAAIFGTDIDDIRDSAVVRSDVKSRIDTMLKSYEW